MQIKFNRVYIIESLQSDDILTGTKLHNELLKWKSISHPGFESVLKNPVNRDDFFSVFDEILSKCINENVSPIIHFEIHGASDQSGLVLSSRELVTWEELSHKIRPINHQLKNGLFITMGVCHGCYFLSKDVVDQPSLFQGIVASFDHLYERDIYIQFSSFYEELFTSFDISKAYEKLIEANPNAKCPDLGINYKYYSSEYIFAMVQIDYDEKQCTEAAFRKRAIDEIASGNLTVVSRQDRRDKIRKFVKLGLQSKNKFFASAYRKYFMLDDFPELEKEISFSCSISAMKSWFSNITL